MSIDKINYCYLCSAYNKIMPINSIFNIQDDFKDKLLYFKYIILDEINSKQLEKYIVVCENHIDSAHIISKKIYKNLDTIKITKDEYNRYRMLCELL